jgi:ABC-2 type transport system permease protein
MSFVTDTTGVAPTPAPAPEAGPQMHLGRLLRSERIKMTSTKTWWLFGIGVVVATGLALLINCAEANGENVQTASESKVEDHVANILTSGQYFGGLFVMLLAILLITNEYYHQTATSTFLATPRRTSVVVSKFVMAMGAAAVVWLLTTLLSLAFGGLWLSSQGVGLHLSAWTVQRSILINLLLFALWGVFGIGIGALIRSQIGATVTAVLLYTIGFYAAYAVTAVLANFVFHTDTVYKSLVLVPAVAAQIAETKVFTLPSGQTVAWWVGVIVMVAYGVIMGLIGTLILRKRDVS